MADTEKIIIIGNGFDLNLELKTSYGDFLSSENFKNLLVSNNSLAVYLRQKQNLQHWIDIENELKEYSHRSKNELDEEFNALSTELVNYLSSIKTSAFKKDSEAYSVIKDNYATSALILDFNYTDSVEKILLSLGVSESEILNKHRKVHGSLKENNIIFGVEDAAKIKTEHIFLKKSYPRYYEPTDIRALIYGAREVYFFGHSLGATDHHYFKDSFFHDLVEGKGSNVRNIHLYYHGEEGYKRLFQQIDVLIGNELKRLKANNNIKYYDTAK